MRTRRVVVLLGILAGLGVGVYVASQSAWVRSWWARDVENTAEMGKLADKQLLVQPTADPTAGWFQWRGPTRDGRAPAGAFRTDWSINPPKLLWSTPCGGGYSSCAVVNGRLYTQDRQDPQERIICLDAETGRLLWEYSYPADYSGTDRTYAIGPRATPTVQGDQLVAVGAAGKLLCLKLDGNNPPTLLWEHDLLAEFDARIPRWGVACSPLIEGDLVIVQTGGKRGSVVAFDKTSGQLRWSAGTNPSGYSSPVAATIGPHRMILALTGDALLAIRASDGQVTDSYEWTTQYQGNVATPLVVDDYVFISAAYRQGCALLRMEPQAAGVKFVQVYARRRPPGLQNHHASSVFKDRHLYGFDGDSVAFLKCVNFETGKDVWDAERAVTKGSIVLADRYLLIQTERGELCLVEAKPEEFTLVAKTPRLLSGNNNWATPTLLDGRVYLRDEEKVVCYDLRP
jgi:outer membrane protein assembly factor BamB